MASITLRKFGGSGFSSTTFWHVYRGLLVTSHYVDLSCKHFDRVNLSFPIFTSFLYVFKHLNTSGWRYPSFKHHKLGFGLPHE